MKIGRKGLSIIKHYEGLSLKAYKCPAGKMTVGYGHVILKGENLNVITEEQAEKLLMSDVKWAENCIQESVKGNLTQSEFDALVSFIFNIGAEAFKSSTMLKFLNLQRYRDAATQFIRWDKVGGKVLPGLVKRRAAEKKLFEAGELELT